MLNDIDEQFDDGELKEYFIGTVLVSPAAQKGHFEVIDGQQRQTTLFCCFARYGSGSKDSPYTGR